MGTCAYCRKTDVKLTKEHLWPASLCKRFIPPNGEGSDGRMYIRKVPERFLETEVQIKDVCQDCNNGVLSFLDGYICKLWDVYFCTRVLSGDEVVFHYDYDYLSRWLLKIHYNSARIHNSTDLPLLARLRQYILGQGRRPVHYV